MKRGLKVFLWIFISLALVAGGGLALALNADQLFGEKYTITFYADGFEQDGKQVVVTQNGTVNLPKLEKEGYDFLGWYCGDKPWDAKTKVTEDISLTAKFQIKTFNITFVVEGVNRIKNVEYGVLPVYGNTVPQKATDDLYEYIFTGWDPEVVAAVSDATYTAQFEGSRYRFQVNMTSSHSAAFTATGPGYYYKESNVNININVKAGYVYQGTYLNGQLYSTNTSFQIASITQDYNFDLRFNTIKKSITYHDNSGAENTNPTEYDVEDGIITLSNLSYTGNDFLGWYTQEIGGTKVTQIDCSQLQNYNLYARWAKTNYAINYELRGGTNSPENPTSYTIDSTPQTLVSPTKAGYNFEGWSEDYLGIVKVTETDPSKLSSYTLYANWSIITYTISYDTDDDTFPHTYTVESNPNILPSLSQDGYTFLGWKTQTNEVITQLNLSNLRNLTLRAQWQLITYYLTYNLDGGQASNPTEYNIETETFTLSQPYRDYSVFLGWTGTGISSLTQTITIPKGSKGDRYYTAYWDYIDTTLSFSVNGTMLNDYSITQKVFTVIVEPEIDTSLYGMTGYSIDGWYTDSYCNNRFTFSTMPTENKTLYGKWGDYVNSYGFYTYISKFDNAVANSSQTMTISTKDELLAWIEYVQFYDVTKRIYFNASSVYAQESEEPMALLDKYIDQSIYPTSARLSYSASSTKSSVYISTSYRNYELGTSAMIDADPSKTSVHPQVEYALAMDYNPITRNPNYNGHKIKNVPFTLKVTTSNQLMYVLEHGIRPILVSGSPAEDVYNKAVAVLNNIIDDDMTDLQKCRAIYEWIVLNVNYDHAALTLTDNGENWQKIDAWYAEGVFNHHKAVCDGISKAFLIMAKIENIPTLRVVSVNHAWNKVYINGNWFGVDATHGDKSVGGQEVLSYDDFMFTDAFKVDPNGGKQTAINYLEDNFAATTVFNAFETIQGTYNSHNFDLFINDYTNASNNELVYLLASTRNFAYTGEYYTVAIAWSVKGVSLIGNLYTFARNAGVSIESYTNHMTSLDGVQEYVLFVSHN